MNVVKCIDGLCASRASVALQKIGAKIQLALLIVKDFSCINKGGFQS